MWSRLDLVNSRRRRCLTCKNVEWGKDHQHADRDNQPHALTSRNHPDPPKRALDIWRIVRASPHRRTTWPSSPARLDAAFAMIGRTETERRDHTRTPCEIARCLFVDAVAGKTIRPEPGQGMEQRGWPDRPDVRRQLAGCAQAAPLTRRASFRIRGAPRSPPAPGRPPDRRQGPAWSQWQRSSGPNYRRCQLSRPRESARTIRRHRMMPGIASSIRWMLA
jgi:hypothetical protein